MMMSDWIVCVCVCVCVCMCSESLLYLFRSTTMVPPKLSQIVQSIRDEQIHASKKNTVCVCVCVHVCVCVRVCVCNTFKRY